MADHQRVEEVSEGGQRLILGGLLSGQFLDKSPGQARRHLTQFDALLLAPRGSAQIGVEIQHKDRLLTDPGTIEDVRAVENDVVPFDRADVLEQGCVTAFLGDSPRSPRPRDLLGLPIGFETERSWPGVDKNGRINRRYMTRQ